MNHEIDETSSSAWVAVRSNCRTMGGRHIFFGFLAFVAVALEMFKKGVKYQQRFARLSTVCGQLDQLVQPQKGCMLHHCQSQRKWYSCCVMMHYELYVGAREYTFVETCRRLAMRVSRHFALANMVHDHYSGMPVELRGKWHLQPRSLPRRRTTWPYFCSLVISWSPCFTTSLYLESC